MNRPQYLLLTLFLLFTSLPVFAAKTDIIILRNGDHITGEIKGLSAGQLELSTEYMSTVYIDWINIREIISNQGQHVDLSDGRRLYGTLGKPPARTEDEANLVIINTAEGAEQVSALELVRMYPVGTDFWDSVDLSVTLGFNFDKSSSVGKFNVGADAAYRTVDHVTLSKFSSEITTQKTVNNTSRTVLNLDHLRNRPNKRYFNFFGSAEQNDQLGVSLRALAGAGYGWVPIADSRNWLSVGGGLAVNREIPLDDSETKDNLEAVGALRYLYFRRGTPERTADIYLKIFPSLSQFGRIRADFTSTINWEIINDFFIGMELYASYDGKPQAAEAAHVDYGARSTIGYKF